MQCMGDDFVHLQGATRPSEVYAIFRCFPRGADEVRDTAVRDLINRVVNRHGLWVRVDVFQDTFQGKISVDAIRLRDLCPIVMALIVPPYVSWLAFGRIFSFHPVDPDTSLSCCELPPVLSEHIGFRRVRIKIREDERVTQRQIKMQISHSRIPCRKFKSDAPTRWRWAGHSGLKHCSSTTCLRFGSRRQLWARALRRYCIVLTLLYWRG